MTEFASVEELFSLARENLPPSIREFILSGEGSGEALRRNRRALDRLTIEQSILTTHDDVNIATDFLGLHLPSPVLIAPFGGSHRFHSDGDFEVARGVRNDGSLWAVHFGQGIQREEVAAEAEGPLLYQLYCDSNTDLDLQRDLIARIEGCESYKAICVTVDSPVNRLLGRDIATDGLLDRDTVSNARSGGHRFTWDDLDVLRGQIHLPMGLKGVMSVEDAKRAVDRGADFVWVSNHGGRHLDSARATIDLLPEIAKALGDYVPLIVDSGFQRGSDVYKGVARGATLVGLGKVAACALAVGGAEGVASLLQIVQHELKIAMAYSGHASLRELTPDLVGVVDY